MAEKRIVIVDNEPLFPDLIKEMIDKEEGFKVSQITKTREAFLKVLEQDSFDVALIDISIREREDGIGILQILKKHKAQLPSIVLSAHSEIDYAFKCLQAGARGYVNKAEIHSTLISALKEVCCGHLFVSGERGIDILNQYKESYPS